MPDLSVIVPCYNEWANIRPMLDRFAEVSTGVVFELILVDNGSHDGTAEMREELLEIFPFLRWHRIEKNIGYGNGIYRGLLLARGKYVAYTHADLQTDPADVFVAFRAIEPDANNSFLIKGLRQNRNFASTLFSSGLDALASVILRQKFSEINAQPNLFQSGFVNMLDNPPHHWGFDLYVYNMALKHQLLIKRIPVVFPDRKWGVSKWKTGIFSRLHLSVRMLQYCWQLRRNSKKG